MEYQEFDKLMFRKSRDNIKFFLKQKPYTLDELSRLIGLDRTSVHYQVKVLEKKGIATAKGLGRKVYYGLTKKYRNG